MYRDASTLQDTCDALNLDTPGKNLDCRFIGQFEEATTAIANRPHLALAQNCDHLYATRGWDAVCGPTGDTDCDYAGDDSLMAALAALASDDVRIFVKNGTYTPTATINIANDGVTIVSQAMGDGSAGGASFDLSGGAFDFLINGLGVTIFGADIDFGAGGGSFDWSGSYGYGYRVQTAGETAFDISGDRNTFEKCLLATAVDLDMSGAENSFKDCDIPGGVTDTGDDNKFTNCDIDSTVLIQGGTGSTIHGSVITGLLDLDACSRGSFSNLTVGAGARGIHIHNSAEFLDFHNIYVLAETVDDTNPSIEIYSGTECSFKNIEVGAAAGGPNQVSLYVRESERISFKDGTIATYNGLALNLMRHSEQVAFENVKFSGRAQLIDCEDLGAGTANTTTALFRNCYVLNSGVAHDSYLAVFLSRDNIVGRDERGIVIENCVFEDQDSSFSNGIAAARALVHLTGVEASNLQIDCSTATMNGDGPVVYMTNSVVRGLSIVTGSGTGAAPVAGHSDGIIEVWDSELYDLVLRTDGEWKKPALYVRGTAPLANTTTRSALVDGACFPVAAGWWNSSAGAASSNALLAHILANATVRNLKWTEDNETDNAVVTECLIAMEGDHSVFENSYIYHFDGLLTRVIRVGDTGVPVDHARIENNFIRVKDPRNAAQNLDNCIFCQNPGGGDLSEHGIIRGNFIKWDGDGSGTTPLNTESVIYVGLANYFWKVVENHIELEDITLPVVPPGIGDEIIYFASNVFPSGAGGGDGGGAVCTGNTIYNINTAAGNITPTIDTGGGAATVGQTDNLLGRA